MEQEHNSHTPDPVAAEAKERFGIDYLFPYQRLVISNILRAAGVEGFAPAPYTNPVTGEPETADTLPHQIVILPTGAGKSLCFMLPAFMLPGPSLVIFPLLSLMADQERRAQEAGLSSAVLRGGQSREERQNIWQDIEDGTVQMVLTNPETALLPETLRRIRGAGFRHLVIDEMHTVSEWGESFRPVYLEIGILSSEGNIPLVTAFTATASELIIGKIKKVVFPDVSPNIITANPDRPNIGYTFIPSICKEYDLARLLTPGDSAASTLKRPALVFCRSRTGTEMTARYLRRRLKEQEIFFYHAGLNKDEKKNVENWFFQSGGGILCATCAYGMGIDKKNIRTVIHRDLPPSIEAYLQESGRAGRDREAAEAVVLYSEEDRALLEELPDRQERERYAALLAVCGDRRSCRRERLLELLGAKPEACFGCDVCRGSAAEHASGLRELLDFFSRRNRRYSLRQSVHITAGIKTYEVRTEELWKDRYFGCLQGWSHEEIEAAIQTCIKEGSLRYGNRFLFGDRIAAVRNSLGSFGTKHG